MEALYSGLDSKEIENRLRLVLKVGCVEEILLFLKSSSASNPVLLENDDKLKKHWDICLHIFHRNHEKLKKLLTSEIKISRNNNFFLKVALESKNYEACKLILRHPKFILFLEVSLVEKISGAEFGVALLYYLHGVRSFPGLFRTIFSTVLPKLFDFPTLETVFSFLGSVEIENLPNFETYEKFYEHIRTLQQL